MGEHLPRQSMMGKARGSDDLLSVLLAGLSVSCSPWLCAALRSGGLDA